MIKKAAILLGVVALVALNLSTPDVDVPMSLHICSWYIGIAIWFSLTVPMRTGRTLETLKDVGPGTRVVVGLLWPIYILVWFTVRFIL